jgi:hypothetical protein
MKERESPAEQDRRQEWLDEIATSAMARVVSQVAAEKPPISRHFFYGASAIHPKYLVTWYLFKSDSELKAARKNGLTARIEAATRAELAGGGYPEEGVGVMQVAFTSDQDIQRTTGGDSYKYFK